MSTIKNQEIIAEGNAWTQLFDAAADGGPARAIEVSNDPTSEGTLEVIVVPTHVPRTPITANTGLYMAAGAAKEFVHVVNGQAGITEVHVRAIGGNALANLVKTAG